MTDLVPVAAT